MKRDTKITQFAKKLVELSKEDGVVTKVKVNEVLNALKQVQYRHHLAILKIFLNYIRREIALQTAIVSTPTALGEQSLKALEAYFTKLRGRPISAVTQPDTSLIAGVRVRVGDDVYDASVAGRLQRLAGNVH